MTPTLTHTHVNADDLMRAQLISHLATLKCDLNFTSIIIEHEMYAYTDVIFNGTRGMTHFRHHIAQHKRVLKDQDSNLPTGSLEAGMKAHQEGMITGDFKDMLLRLNPINVLRIKKTHISKQECVVISQRFYIKVVKI